MSHVIVANDSSCAHNPRFAQWAFEMLIFFSWWPLATGWPSSDSLASLAAGRYSTQQYSMKLDAKYAKLAWFPSARSQYHQDCITADSAIVWFDLGLVFLDWVSDRLVGWQIRGKRRRWRRRPQRWRRRCPAPFTRAIRLHPSDP